MAQRRSVAGEEQRRCKPALEWDRRMADGVDPSVKTVKTAIPSPARNHRIIRATSGQLPMMDDTPLGPLRFTFIPHGNRMAFASTICVPAGLPSV